jgi:tetratricopeptide (TPR) repeat protein
MRRPASTNVLIALLLAGITFALYGPAAHFDLIYFDDPLFVTDCAEFNRGVTWHSLAWAGTSVVVANWHPLTNFTFLLTHQFFGADPGVEHLVNAAFHAANAALVFLLLLRLTQARWRSAVVAAIFAWHPLRVESVAWIAERKDVLCAFFFLLALLAWTKKVMSDEWRVASGRHFSSLITRHSPLVFFALALLSKPMAVTLPFVLLLLDVWPLRRVEGWKLKVEGSGQQKFQPATSNLQLVTEKWPFFALMFLFCAVTYWVQRDYAAMTPWDKLGLDARVANAISSYINYIAKLFWPLNLAAIYPFPKDYDVTETVLKAALLAAVSLGCWQQLARRPWLAVGWGWYLGTAVPIIGIIQVGEQAMADRYTYLPLIGPVVALVWTAADFFPRRRGGKIFLAAASVLILSALLVLSARQLQFWRNTITLFAHNLAVTPDNASAEFTLGLGFEHAGDTNRALVCYRVAKMIEPRDFQNRRNLANLLAKQGQLDAAETEFDSLLADNSTDYQNHLGLADLLARQGRADESYFQLNETLRLYPDCVEALNNLAWALATSPRADIRDGPRAVQLAQHACELTHFEKTIFIGTLAAAQAAAGKFDAALATAQRACDLAQKNGETNLLQRNQELLERYRVHQTAQ